MHLQDTDWKNGQQAVGGGIAECLRQKTTK